jgi:MFS transporter, DHA1 family, inner membrane transport protein
MQVHRDPCYRDGVNTRFAPTALMLGNIVTGCSIMAPAGMLNELAESLDVSIRTAGLLITFGAVVLCVGSPLTAWLTGRVERRRLLTVTLAVLAITNLASAFAPNYATLMVIRLIMMAIGVIYTPQAAGTAALMVPVEKRGSTIAYIFLGWSLAAAIGLPLITFVASRYGWHVAYIGIGVGGIVSTALLAWQLPGKLYAAPIALRTWIELGRNRLIVLLLAITVLQMSGQFTIFTYLGPLLKQLTGASPDAIGLVFAFYGGFGFVGILIATRIVDSWGAYRTSVLFTSLLFVGVAGWALGAGVYALMAGGAVSWGLGFASTNSMQQVRLVAAAPPLAPASVALNTSVLYVGQALGSFVGGIFYSRELLHEQGFVGAAFVAVALTLVFASRPKQGDAS